MSICECLTRTKGSPYRLLRSAQAASKPAMLVESRRAPSEGLDEREPWTRLNRLLGADTAILMDNTSDLWRGVGIQRLRNRPHW
jgi:hypothetical protein